MQARKTYDKNKTQVCLDGEILCGECCAERIAYGEELGNWMQSFLYCTVEDELGNYTESPVYTECDACYEDVKCTHDEAVAAAKRSNGEDVYRGDEFIQFCYE